MTVLAGIRVIDFCEYIAGPFGTMLLGDMGADVIKVEPPGGDRWRQGEFYAPHESRNNLSMNRSKRSIALDLATDEGRDIVYSLVRGADVVVHNFRTGVAERLGIDYESLSSENPAIIYCHNTAFGTQGDLASKGGFDILSMAANGFLTGPAARIEDDRLVAPTAVPIIDITSSIFQALAICGALWQREQTGHGQKIDSSLLGAGIAIQASRILSVERADREPRESFLEDLQAMEENQVTFEGMLELRPQLGRFITANLYYRAYETADRPIALACLNDRLRRKFTETIGIRDPRLEDPSIDPSDTCYQATVAELVSKAEATMRSKTIAEWTALFDADGIPCAQVNFVEEIFNDSQVLANGLLVELEHSTVGSIKMAGAPYAFSGTPLDIHRPPPALSEHTDEILAELGYVDEDIQSLRARKIVT